MPLPLDLADVAEMELLWRMMRASILRRFGLPDA